jgi:hypothetical protein
MFVNVLFVSDIYFSKCFMLPVLYNRAREVSADGGGPRVHVRSEAGATATHACAGACVPQQQAGSGRQARQ